MNYHSEVTIRSLWLLETENLPFTYIMANRKIHWFPFFFINKWEYTKWAILNKYLYKLSSLVNSISFSLKGIILKGQGESLCLNACSPFTATTFSNTACAGAPQQSHSWPALLQPGYWFCNRFQGNNHATFMLKTLKTSSQLQFLHVLHTQLAVS